MVELIKRNRTRTRNFRLSEGLLFTIPSIELLVHLTSIMEMKITQNWRHEIRFLLRKDFSFCLQFFRSISLRRRKLLQDTISISE